MTTATSTRVATSPLYVVFPAEDLERARSFYRDKLGIELEDAPGGLIGKAGSGTGLFVYEHSRTKAEHTAGVFVVEDLGSSVSELRERGVVFEEYDMPGLKTVEGIAEYPDGTRAAWFVDSEGNIISLTEMGSS